MINGFLSYACYAGSWVLWHTWPALAHLARPLTWGWPPLAPSPPPFRYSHLAVLEQKRLDRARFDSLESNPCQCIKQYPFYAWPPETPEREGPVHV